MLSLEPHHTTLLVIDLQKGFSHPRWGRRNNPSMEQRASELLREPIDSPGYCDKPPGVTKAVENARMDPKLQGMRSP